MENCTAFDRRAMPSPAIGYYFVPIVILISLALGAGIIWLSRDRPADLRTAAHDPIPMSISPERPPRPAAPKPLPDSPDRVADARARFETKLRADFQAAGLAYPPRAIYLRAFKHEGQLELWALPNVDVQEAKIPYRLVRTFPILRASGRLGPKRREGDRQVPEGVYTIDRFNPRSLFYLSLGLDYPNASDRLLADDPQQPGSDIFIHGGAESIGCLAVGDDAAAQLFLSALDANGEDTQRAIPVHIFPCRMTAENWQELLAPLCAERPELGAFCRGLQPIYEAFEKENVPPIVEVKADGSYALEFR